MGHLNALIPMIAVHTQLGHTCSNHCLFLMKNLLSFYDKNGKDIIYSPNVYCDALEDHGALLGEFACKSP